MLRHPAIALILALILALAAPAAAVARMAAAGPGMEVTLCTGEGPVTVTLDAQGNPVATAHHCPACILAQSPPPPEPVLTRPAQRLAPLCPITVARLSVQVLFPPTPPSRAPPVSA